MIAETCFLAEEKHAIRVQIFRDHGPSSDNSKKYRSAGRQRTPRAKS
jgi:hypothetical protein